MTPDLESSLRTAAATVTLGLSPEDEKALKRFGKVRQWLKESPPPETPGTYLLVLGRKGDAPFWFTIAGPALIMGRAADAGLVLDSPKVSRQHGVLETDGTDWCLRDLGSTNGVHVNGKKVDHAWLTSGDILQVGDFRLFFLQVQDVES